MRNYEVIEGRDREVGLLQGREYLDVFAVEEGETAVFRKIFIMPYSLHPYQHLRQLTAIKLMSIRLNNINNYLQ